MVYGWLEMTTLKLRHYSRLGREGEPQGFLCKPNQKLIDALGASSTNIEYIICIHIMVRIEQDGES